MADALLRDLRSISQLISIAKKLTIGRRSQSTFERQIQPMAHLLDMAIANEAIPKRQNQNWEHRTCKLKSSTKTGIFNKDKFRLYFYKTN